MRRAVALLLAGVAIAACAEVFPVGPREAVGEASDELFLLVVRSPASTYAADQPIEVFAELIYQGPKNRETVYHAASPVGWQIVQLDGDAVMEGAMADPCLSTEMVTGDVRRHPFQKSGVVAEPFDEAWFDDPLLRLPPGRWRFVATMAVSLGDCGGEIHRLEATIDLAVGP